MTKKRCPHCDGSGEVSDKNNAIDILAEQCQVSREEVIRAVRSVWTNLSEWHVENRLTVEELGWVPSQIKRLRGVTDYGRHH